MNEQKSSLAVLALETFGEDVQFDQVQEELAELVVAINHYRRGRISILGLRGEIADVEIMLEQLRELVARVDPDAMDRTREQKRAKALKHISEARARKQPPAVDPCRVALGLIARGHISPSLEFAQRVLDGEDPREALTAEIAASRARS